MRILTAALVLTLVAASPALAGPGGALSGDIAVEWASGAAEPGNGWNGGVAVTLEAGAAATARAAAALRDSGRTYREVRPFFVQSSQIGSLSSSRSFRRGGPDWCTDAEGNPAAGETTTSQVSAGVTQPLVPFTVDQPDLDLLRGRGRIAIGLYTDNPGYQPGSDTHGLPAGGAYFMPVPGTATSAYRSSACGETAEETGPVGVFSTRADGLVPFAFAEWLNVTELPLVRRDGVWTIDVTRDQEATTSDGELPLAMRYRIRLRMGDDLRDMQARCRVPGPKQLKGLSVRGARARLAQAGFPRARFAGSKPSPYVKRGQLIVDPSFTSSGYRGCGDRPKLFRVTRSTS
jgi:hypothetical protein